ncbi:MAG: AP2/ERF family transcription factor [Gammaproteobacteria bacterium]|nr:AP2/ERF family transcription factor [Gammaproteobacteria bacterium]MDP2139354.1 AP2/ERF family transcription factor [Gammaproteobacteria bacterium]MDP2347269.1 AP2/ERF family transcription factor [Gammaproteobacteria bacterium]
MKRLDPLHHISIIESRGTNCAWVRIKYDNKSFQESFPFKKYGGKDEAIKAAKKKRDEEGKKIYGENWPFTKFSPRKVSPLNSSGEIGVSYSESDHAWVATWQENIDGNRRQRNAYFSINKYGDKKARTMAVQRRRAEVDKNKIAS